MGQRCRFHFSTHAFHTALLSSLDSRRRRGELVKNESKRNNQVGLQNHCLSIPRFLYVPKNRSFWRSHT